MKVRSRNGWLLAALIALDALIIGLLLLMPRSGLEELAAFYVLLPLILVRLGIAAFTLFRSARHRHWGMGVYTLAALAAVAGLWYLSATLKPSYEPLHKVLRVAAVRKGEQVATQMDRRAHDRRRAAQRASNPDHAALCDLMDVAQDLQALQSAATASINEPCANYYGDVVPPLLHVIMHTYGPWTGGELLRPDADEAYVAPAAEWLLASGADPNVRDAMGNTPLHYALIFQNERLAKALLSNGACVLIQNDLGESARSTHSSHTLNRMIDEALQDPDMMRACGDLPDVSQQQVRSELKPITLDAAIRRCGEDTADAIQKLSSSGADVNLMNAKGETPLMAAVRHCIGAVPLLVDAGADVNQANRSGQTPLLRAARMRATEAVLVLLASGADVNHQNKAGNTVLHVLARAREVPSDLLRAVLTQDAELELKNRAGETPLVTAIEHGSVDMVAELISAGADISVRRARGHPLLNTLISCDAQDLAKLELLLKAGADPGIGVASGALPLALAFYNHLYLDCLAPARLLLAAGADPNQRDEFGRVALHGIAYWSQKDPGQALELLKQYGAQIDAPDPQGRTTLLLAAGSEASSLTLQRLLEHGADPQRRNAAGQTALAVAQAVGNERAVALLEGL